MKRSIFACALLAVAGCVCLQAQPFAVRASIPFDFTIGKSTLPAGDYYIDRLSPGVLRVQNESDRPKSVLTITSAATRPEQKSDRGMLVFNRIAGNYFLEKVWVPGNPTGADLQTSAAEKQLARRGSTGEEVTLALR